MTTTINEKSRPTGGMDGAAKGDEASTLGVGVRSLYRQPRPITPTMRKEMEEAAEIGEGWVHPDEWFNATFAGPFDQLINGIANQLPWATPAQFAACDHALALLNRVADQLEIIRQEEAE